MPKENEPDLEDPPREVREKIEMFLVRELRQVLAFTLAAPSFRGRQLRAEKNPRDVLPLSVGFSH